MQATSIDAARKQAHLEHLVDDKFDDFAKALHAHFESKVGAGIPLFKTGTTGLTETYLSGFPVEVRQVYNCDCCKDFIRRYGQLVTIDPFGNIESPLWSIDPKTVPALYRKPVANLNKLVLSRKVTGVFISDQVIWGTPITGDWHHLAVKPPASMVWGMSHVTHPHQRAAELLEDRGMIVRALGEYNEATVTTALAVLRAGDTLYRSEKVLGVAEWFAGLRGGMLEMRSPEMQNVLWLAAATAPKGFAHVRTSMIGTLLDDIIAGKSLENIKRSFAAKMHPLQYQRPTAAPAAGAIDAAEKLVEKMGIAASLRRRFARMDEVQKFWEPKVEKPRASEGGVFGHLKPSIASSTLSDSTGQVMTWEKFSRVLLPAADKIEIYVPAKGNFTAFVTATDPDAPPILQWDFEGARNPVSQYVYHGGSPSVHWGLSSGFKQIAGIARRSSHWNGSPPNHREGVIFLLDNMVAINNPGTVLFPETLKSELHAIRHVVEAHNRNSKLDGPMDCAGGLSLDGKGGGVQLRVTCGNVASLVTIDRFD